MRCSACGREKTSQTAGGNAAGPPRLASGWSRPLMPCRTGMPAVRAAAARVLAGMPVPAAMSLRLRLRAWYCSRSQCGSMSLPGGAAGCRSPAPGQQLPDGVFAASGDPGDLAQAESLPGKCLELLCAGGFRRPGCRAAGRELGGGVAGGSQPDVLGGGAGPGGPGAGGKARLQERVEVAGVDVAGVRAGPGDAGDPAVRWFPADGFVDANGYVSMGA